ncbi:amidase [Algoriphagus halophilus]|uniref:Asp-tRNAAsn/Glu-tRNAGln amidotransferase A subunit n=1 Tax=Algoriphagus halophilus TaxID=226505 RepID=A0A1N6DZN4_9BACT|nr:amidase [Algoriphagus halophilus]SIN76238.1 Asp-tRNAAsn/Glu-tRNAGln amidotransferase A subunit [Algoriphagus halophilus]
MKKYYPAIYTLLCLGVILSCKSNEYGFTDKDIKGSQKLIGLNFEKPAIETMSGYLGRNKSGYDSLRSYEISNETFPAITFDPHPLGFVFPEKVENPEFIIPEQVEVPENFEELAFYTIPQLASLIKNKKVTSEELTRLFIDRIKRYDDQLESVITLTEDLAMKQAKQADKELAAGNYRGILHGIPYGVKDLMAVEGYPTTWGAAPYKDQMIDYTATVVKKLEDQGAVLVAKLVSGSLARGDVWFGGKTKNPWDTTQGASGSSAGSGSATSAGLVPFALGTETLGSITAPATRNGVTGLRPTYGRVSRAGVMSLSWSMDKIGPLARTAEDCEIIFSAIYGKDEKDPSTNEIPFNHVSKSPKELKVAYLKKDLDKDTTAMGNNLRASLEVFKAMGVEPDSIALPENFPYSGFDIILRAEAGAFFDELVRSGEVDLMVEQHGGSRANSLRQSRFIPAVEYLQANRQRRQLIEEVNQLFQEYDVIIAPSFGGRQLLITNLTGHPVISVPNGFDKKERPTSFTLIGNLYDEGSILALAKAFQDATDFEEKHPPKFID